MAVSKHLIFQSGSIFLFQMAGLVRADDRVDLLGQHIGDTPQLLAPGVINTGLATRDVALTADGREIFFCVYTSGDPVFLPRGCACRMRSTWDPCSMDHRLGPPRLSCHLTAKSFFSVRNG